MRVRCVGGAIEVLIFGGGALIVCGVLVVGGAGVVLLGCVLDAGGFAGGLLWCFGGHGAVLGVGFVLG